MRLPARPAGSLLEGYDAAWLAYLDQFTAWKGADAAALEVGGGGGWRGGCGQGGRSA